jgi:hypothetical protein
MERNNNIDPSDPVRKREDIISRVIDDQILLLCPDSYQLFKLNEVGTRIWGLLDRYSKVDDIINCIRDYYKIDRDSALSDVLSFLNELSRKNIIKLG